VDNCVLPAMQGRTHARDIPTAELLNFSTLFSDKLTLDKLSHPQLVALSKLLLLPTYGVTTVLNFQLRMKLRQLHADDLLIQRDGVDNLSVQEVQEACRARGMRALGVSEGGLKDRLKQWIKLHVDEKVPSSLLLMSRVLYLPESLTPEAQIATVLDNLPETIKDEVQVTAAETEAVYVEPEAKLAVLESEEALIANERAEEEAAKAQELELQAPKEKKQRGMDEEELRRSAQPGSEDHVLGDKEKARFKEPPSLSSSAQAVKESVEDSDADVETLVDKEGLKDLAETIFEDNMERDFVEHLKEDISAQESELELLSTEPNISVEVCSFIIFKSNHSAVPQARPLTLPFPLPFPLPVSCSLSLSPPRPLTLSPPLLSSVPPTLPRSCWRHCH